jgi:chromosome segregation ATPase
VRLLQECQASLQAAQQSTSDRDQALDALADELVEVNTGLEEAEAARQQAEEQVRQGSADWVVTCLSCSTCYWQNEGPYTCTAPSSMQAVRMW